MRQNVACLVLFLMGIGAREKLLPLALLPGARRTHHPATRGRAAQAEEPLVGHTPDPQSPGWAPLLSTSAPADTVCRLPPGTTGEKGKWGKRHSV